LSSPIYQQFTLCPVHVFLDLQPCLILFIKRKRHPVGGDALHSTLQAVTSHDSGGVAKREPEKLGSKWSTDAATIRFVPDEAPQIPFVRRVRV
jgi:hypothetical protein